MHRARMGVFCQSVFNDRVRCYHGRRVAASDLRIVLGKVLLLPCRVKRGRNSTVTARSYPNADRVAMSKGRGCIRRCRRHTACRKRVDSPAHFIGRLMPRKGVRVSARGSFNDRRSERCPRSQPMVETSSVTRGVRVRRSDRRYRRYGSSRGLRNLHVCLLVIFIPTLSRSGELMYVTRDLYGRHRRRDGFTNDSVGTRLRNDFHLVQVSGEGGGLVNRLVRSAHRTGCRWQRAMDGRPLRRFFVRRVDGPTWLQGRTGRGNENTCRVRGRNVTRIVPFRPCVVSRVRYCVRRSGRRFRYHGLGKALLMTRVDREGTLGDVRHRRGRRRTRMPKVLAMLRPSNGEIRGRRPRYGRDGHPRARARWYHKMRARQIVLPFVNGTRRANFRTTHRWCRRRNRPHVCVHRCTVTTTLYERHRNVCKRR